MNCEPPMAQGPVDVNVRPVAWPHDQPERYDVVHDEAKALWLKAWPQQAAHFQFRDLRAKAVTDMREASGIDAAKDLAGHASVVMTEQYTRNRRGGIRSANRKLPSKIQG